MTSVHWLGALLIGSGGGAINALLSDPARLWPSVVTRVPGGTRVVRVGIVGNLLTGAAAAVCLYFMLQATGSTLYVKDGLGLLLLGCSDLFVAFVTARWVTNEVDKSVLRQAVVKAASAPAAHPDTVGQMEIEPPYRIYTLVEGLMPRRAGHR